MTTTTANKKPTLATLKSFIRKNLGNLWIRVNSSFDGMTDCVQQCKGAQFAPAAMDDGNCRGHNLGIRGLWLVLGSRYSIRPIKSGEFEGFEVYNCCGSCTIATRKVSRGLRVGYAFMWVGSEKVIPRIQDWDTTVCTSSEIAEAQYRGQRTIDGSLCNVFYIGESGDNQVYMAQVAIGEGCRGEA